MSRNKCIEKFNKQSDNMKKQIVWLKIRQQLTVEV